MFATHIAKSTFKGSLAKFYIIYFVIAGFIAIAFTAFAQYKMSQFSYEKIITGGNWGYIGLILLLFYSIISIRSISTDEVAAITIFGKPVADLEQGLVYAPLGIIGVTKFPRGVIQTDMGEHAGGRESKTVRHCPKSLKTMSGGDDKAKSMLERRMRISPLGIVRYQIVSPCQLLGIAGSLDDVDSLIHGTIKGVLEEIIPSKKVEELYGHIQQVNNEIQNRVETLSGDTRMITTTTSNAVESWGVDILSFQLESLGLPPEIENALNAANAAIKEAEKVETLAAAEATRVTVTGTAEAEVIGLKRKKEGEGEADALSAKAKILSDKNIGDAARSIAWLETVTEISDKLKVPVISGSGGPFGLAELVKAGFSFEMGKGLLEAAKKTEG